MKNTLEINIVCTDEEYIDNNLNETLGTQLLNITIDYCKDNGISRCYLEATNLKLIKYYRKFGFGLIGDNENIFSDNDSGDVEYPMEKILFEI